MPARRALVVALLVLAGFSNAAGTEQAPAAVARPGGETELDDVPAAFARIPTEGEHRQIQARGFIARPRYRTALSNFFGYRNHFQGIQRIPGSRYLVLSGANHPDLVSQLFVISLDADEGSGRVVARMQIDGARWHAGGISVLGTTMAVPIYGDVAHSGKIVFFDVSTPETPKRLPVEIARPGRKGVAAALTRLPDGRWVTAVLSGYDGLPRRIDFYFSRSAAIDGGFGPPQTWLAAQVRAGPGQEKSFGHFQNINFVRQRDGRLFLAGFHNSVAPPALLPGRDYADLYEVVLPSSLVTGGETAADAPIVTKVGSRRLRCTGGYCNFAAAAGIYADPETGSLTLYATPGWLDGDVLKMTRYGGILP